MGFQLQEGQGSQGKIFRYVIPPSLTNELSSPVKGMGIWWPGVRAIQEIWNIYWTKQKNAAKRNYPGKIDDWRLLANIRRGLRSRVSEFYGRFPHEVETSYWRIWQRWCDGEAPSPLPPLS